MAEIRPLAKPVKFISATAETELRELLTKLTDAGLRTDTNSDAFLPEYFAAQREAMRSADHAAALQAYRDEQARKMNDER